MPQFKKAKSSNWIESDQFGDFASDKFEENPVTEPNKAVKGRKRPRENNNTLKDTKSFSLPQLPEDQPPPLVKNSLDSTKLWIYNHVPTSIDDLAVNNKKIDEVRSWLLDSIDKGGILVLSGPAGSGKTATLNALATSLQMSVKEWVNPVEQIGFKSDKVFDDENFIFSDTVGYVSKSKQFREWLRGTKYSTINDQKGFRNNIVLVEDMPSNRLEDLHEILESFVGSKAKVPLVFIISESATSKKNGSVKQIFPPQVVDRLKITNINFNPVTTSSMVKVFTKIAKVESQKGVRKFQVPDKATLENLAESVGGDLRGGINALQFSCLNDTQDLKGAFETSSLIASSKGGKSGSKNVKKFSNRSELSKIGGKDKGLMMFHALGKILYSKRDDDLESEGLPKHLQSHSRRVLKSNPDEVIEKSTLSADAFNCFLHQNFPPFFTKIDEVQRLSEYISISDMFMNEWTTGGKISLTEYGGSVAARAVMFTNTAPPSSLGMRKLNKPDYYNNVRTLRQRQYDLQNVFHAQPNTELVTSSLPYIAKIRPSLLPAHKMAKIIEIGSFPSIKHVSMKSSAFLEQNDNFVDDEIALDVCSKHLDDGNKIEDIIDEEEEVLIEEFDD